MIARPTNEFGFDRGILESWLGVRRDLRRAGAAKDRFTKADDDAKVQFGTYLPRGEEEKKQEE